MRTQYSSDLHEHLRMTDIEGWFLWSELDEILCRNPKLDGFAVRNRLVLRDVRQNALDDISKKNDYEKNVYSQLLGEVEKKVSPLRTTAIRCERKPRKENTKPVVAKKKTRMRKKKKDQLHLLQDLLHHQENERKTNKSVGVSRPRKPLAKDSRNKKSYKARKSQIKALNDAKSIDIDHKESLEILDLLVNSKKEELLNPDREEKAAYWRGMCHVVHRSFMINTGIDPDVYDQVASTKPTETLATAVGFYEEFIRSNLAGKIVKLIGNVEKRGLFKKYPPSENPIVFASFQQSSTDFLPDVGYLIPFKNMAAKGIVPPDPSKIHIPEGELIAYGLHWSFKLEYNLFGAFYRVSPTRINYFWVIHDRLAPEWWTNSVIFKKDGK